MHFITYYNTYDYSNKTLESLNENPYAETIIDNNMIIIINDVEMYVFPINTNYDNRYVKYTTYKPSLTNNILLHNVKLYYNNYDTIYPTYDSLELLYTKTIEILNHN